MLLNIRAYNVLQISHLELAWRAKSHYDPGCPGRLVPTSSIRRDTMSSRFCRPEMSGTYPREKRASQASFSHGTSASHRRASGKLWAAVATIVTVLITAGQLAVNVRDGEHKEQERCFDPKFLDQL